MTHVKRITTLDENGPPPVAPAALYQGDVMHQRIKPFGHRFSYPVFSLLIDIDRLEEADHLSPLFSVEKPNLIAFRAADHLDPEETSLRRQADRLLSEAGLTGPAARIVLLCYPRMFGYVFNPISTWYAFDDDGALLAVIYTVRNTFGEKHSHVARVEQGELSNAGLRQSRSKLLHVSPFIGMDARYHFRVLPPGRIARLRIHETENGEALFAASFVGAHRPLTTRTLTGVLLRFPLMTWKVMTAIHWQALKLWLKGARFHRSPPPPAKSSYGDRDRVLQPGE